MTVTARIYNRNSGSLTTQQVEWPDFRARMKKAGLVQDDILPTMWVSDEFIVRIINHG